MPVKKFISATDVYKLSMMAKDYHVSFESLKDDQNPPYFLVILDGFTYDSPTIAANDLQATATD